MLFTHDSIDYISTDCIIELVESGTYRADTFLAIPGVELRASQLLGKHSTNRTMPSTLLTLIIFQIGTHVFTPASLDHDSSVNTFCISRMAGVHHHTCG
jgi:hypothetical protein